MRSFFLNIGNALSSLSEQRSRAALSALGIMVGSLAIVLLISIAKGVQEDITGQVDSLGVNLLIVVPFRIPEGDGGFLNPNVAGISYLKEADASQIKKLAGVRDAVPWVFPGGIASAGKAQSGSSLIIATPPEWFSIRPVQMEEGRLFSEADLKSPVCVLGGIAKRNLFGGTSALGKHISIGRTRYRVLGVTRQEQTESLLSSLR